MTGLTFEQGGSLVLSDNFLKMNMRDTWLNFLWEQSVKYLLGDQSVIITTFFAIAVPNANHITLEPTSWIIHHRNLNSMENWFQTNSIISYHNVSKLCKCHNNTAAVMPCPKFHSNDFSAIWIREKCDFHQIGNAIGKYDVQLALGLCYNRSWLILHYGNRYEHTTDAW